MRVHGAITDYQVEGTVSKHKHFDTICTMLDQRRRRWADVVQMLCKCFVFVGQPLEKF